MTIINSLRNIKSFKKYDGEIGLEIETETKQPYEVPEFTYWTTHGDGSLRDFGIEYVLKQPVHYKKEFPAALEEFANKTSRIPFIRDSISTSVHVHLNILNESWKTLGNYLTTYTLLENLLIRHSGPDRLSNLFCLPMCDAEDTYRNIARLFMNIENKIMKGVLFQEGTVKYAACNLAALYQYGSIEIRSFRGETDTKVIQNWVDLLYSIMVYSRNPDLDPKKIMLSWKESRLAFLDNVFKDHARTLDLKDASDLIDKNVWYASNIAYGIKDWNTLDIEEKIPDFKPKDSELNKMSQSLYLANFNQIDPVQQEKVIFELRKVYDKKYKLTPVVGAQNEPVDFAPVRADRNINDLVRRQRPVEAQPLRGGAIRWEDLRPEPDQPAQAAGINPGELELARRMWQNQIANGGRLQRNERIQNNIQDEIRDIEGNNE